MWCLEPDDKFTAWCEILTLVGVNGTNQPDIRAENKTLR